MKNILQIAFCVLSFSSLFSQNAEIFDQKESIYAAEVYFDFALYDIRIDADSTLKEVIAFCKNQDEYNIKITAHTDFVGTNERNMILSQNRSNAVKTYLVDNGIPENLIEAAVFGEDKPQATNETDKGRQLNRRATIDIFTTRKVVNLEARILDEDSGIPIEADIVVRTKDSRDTLRADANGLFKLPVPLGTVIGIDIYSKCYFLKTKMLKATPENLAKLSFKMRKAEVGKAADIENLFFVGNQDVLLKKSEPELPKILKFMELNDCLNIEIAGHVNVPNAPPIREGSWEYNLSARRAKTVLKYLVKNGIPEDRISHNGYGNWEMRYPNAVSEYQQGENRRVEIRILEGGKDCLCDEVFGKDK
ncbi:MAG: OmpA family protein [Bacteroidetes bacterium]|jgi:outer membrane protein OmpA-like peptidoglycan-associated protein|nr:OmpA family protein [Bacteroidota bacterium]